MSILPGRIREGREYLNFPPELMAERIGITASDYASFEAGEREPTAPVLARLAWLCGTTPERLRGEDLSADPDIEKAIANGLMTHDDAYEVRRFAEFLRVRATAEPQEAS